MNKPTSNEVLVEIIEYMRDTGTRVSTHALDPSSEPSGVSTVAQIQETGFDSLDEVELVTHLEDYFSIEITDEAAEMIWRPERTLQQVAERVAAL